MTLCHKAEGALLVQAVAGVAACGAQPQQHRVELPRAPFLGLACHPTRYPCHRVGLAVWLRRPAEAVTAMLAGQTVTLHTRPGGRGAYARRRFWQGFFSDPRAERLAGRYPSYASGAARGSHPSQVSAGYR